MKYSSALICNAMLLLAPLSAAKAAEASARIPNKCGEFSMAVIPDTQYYNAHGHQKSEGYPIDARDIFLDQMRYIADHGTSAGGDIVFATHVGDVWESPPFTMDAGHAVRGFRSRNPGAPFMRDNSAKTWEVEARNAESGFRLISGKMPFSVVPGNHDMDASWTDANRPAQSSKITMYGGVATFNTIFSNESEFFKDKSWYVGSHDGGADSAQIFTAGKCRFLHIGLQWDAPNATLSWAETILRRFPHMPTIITTHKFIDGRGDFVVPGDASDEGTGSSAVDPEANNPRMIWEKLISRNDQIFMVLSGHRPQGGGYRLEKNKFGHEVHMIMSDYQFRGQLPKEMGVTSDLRLGDGWLRLMKFRLDSGIPTVQVRTYSTYYHKFSTDLKEYSAWYKPDEAKSVGREDMSDEEFLKRDDFSIMLNDFSMRFNRQGR